MLLTYLFCLLAGGVLIALSLEGDNGADADGAGGNLSLLFSTPFWSFGFCGFGLCGLLLSLLSRNGTAVPKVMTICSRRTIAAPKHSTSDSVSKK